MELEDSINIFNNTYSFGTSEHTSYYPIILLPKVLVSTKKQLKSLSESWKLLDWFLLVLFYITYQLLSVMRAESICLL